MAEEVDRQKRQIPGSIQTLLTADRAITKKFCGAVEKFLPLPKYRKYYKALEYSCHTLPWIFGSLAALWLLWNEDLFQTQINLLFGLLISMTVHWLVKELLEDRPPRYTRHGKVCCPLISPSQASANAIFVASFFCYLQPLCSPMRMFLKLWAATVSFSLIAKRKCRFLDVLIGVIIGYLSGFILSLLWLEKDTCRFLLTLNCRSMRHEE